MDPPSDDPEVELVVNSTGLIEVFVIHFGRSDDSSRSSMLQCLRNSCRPLVRAVPGDHVLLKGASGLCVISELPCPCVTRNIDEKLVLI